MTGRRGPVRGQSTDAFLPFDRTYVRTLDGVPDRRESCTQRSPFGPWVEAATAALPGHLHPSVHSMAAALAIIFATQGRSHLAEVELLTRINGVGPDAPSEDALLSGISRLILLGWAEWAPAVGGDALVARTPTEFSYPERPSLRPPRRRDAVSRRVRLGVYMRDDWRCWLCGLEVVAPIGELEQSDWEPALDHVIPHCDGGSDEVENLRTAHRWCNSTRGARVPPDMRVMRARVIGRQADEYARSVCAA